MTGQPGGLAPSITQFIATHLAFLEPPSLRVVESNSPDSARGNAYLLAERPPLRLRFVREKGRLSLELQSTSERSKRAWYSTDLIAPLVGAAPLAGGDLDAAAADLLGEHLPELERLFAPAEWPATKARLDDLRRQRARALFG